MKPHSNMPVIVAVPAPPQHVTHTSTITVKRAPTDESVRLLREMEEAARNEIIKAVRVGNTVFECVVQMTLEPMSDDRRCMAVFKLNGKQMRAEVYVDRRKEPAACFQALRDEVAKVIATEVLGEAFRDALPPSFYRFK